jgi:two-component system NtrC family sensor kinase
MENHAALRSLETSPRAELFPTPVQEFPCDHPEPLQAEQISLESLVHHREFVEASVALEVTYGFFRSRKVEYMAVVDDGRVIGLCSRGQIGFVMGSRFGFALYSHSPVSSALVANPLIVRTDAPIREVLDRALARHGDSFHEDVVLVDPEQRLVGLVQAESLAQLQSRLVAEQLDALRKQHETLRQQNLDLFRANHAARQSQGLYFGLFESHSLGVALLDVEGSIHEHNRRLAELLGFTDSSASLVSLVAWVEEKERAAFLALLRTHAENSAAPATREFTLTVPGRGARIFRCSTGWIKETGQICACLDDITDQRMLERKLVRQEKQMLLDTLVGGIAHELNNKLTPVQGFAELLGVQAGGNGRMHAHYIRKSVEEAAHIIRQLLQLSKPATSTSEPVDLRTVVEETLVMLKFQARAAQCTIRTSLPASPVWVLGDVGQLKQVALNLVLNALQAVEGRAEGQVAVHVHTGDRLAALVVADNGNGIAPENLGRIFDPFFTTKGPERGTGLGLSICYSIIRQHGGEIAVESQAGEGARFTVTLPSDELAGPRVVLREENVCFHPAPGRRGGRVLVVEDDDVVSKLLQELLRVHFGCHVDLATNGRDALAAIGREHYELVISDIQMPEMNGAELFTRLREYHPDIARRFVFVTGHPGGRHLDAEIAHWNVPVIAKPFTVSRLADVCGPFLK